MALIVQKYGGTSVGSVERIQAVAQRVIQTAQTGHGLVVVVSAMGKTTDGLLKLAHEISANPSRANPVLCSLGFWIWAVLTKLRCVTCSNWGLSLTTVG
ncbi:hypothetical protein [Leptolyngbya sp. 7M]|uniref:amino acid kinase family protein n=1 Tax=Leptolyngbya sp. 7M TaxID=2812896 RepID=UPI00293920A6|nr:hypothetical protein [Leptolyngbya sp. 7M]